MGNVTTLEMKEKERRCFKRVFCSAEDQITGIFVFPGNNQIMKANILNISVGGIHFTIERSKLIPLKTGDRLILRKLMGNASLQIVSDIEAEIKWILDYRLLKHVGFGCEFRNLPVRIQSQLASFIESGWGNGEIAM